MAHPFKPAPIGFGQGQFRQINAEARYAGVRYPWIVVGDSRASEWPEDLLARFGAPVANLGLPGAAVQHVLWQLHQTQLDLSGVRQAIVVLGINHLTLGHAPIDIAEGIQHVVRMIRAKSAAAEVAVVEVFPRGPSEDYDDAARVELNRRLANRARGSGLFHTVATRLDDPTDPRQYSDGLHLTRAGYEVLTEDAAAALGSNAPRAHAVWLRQDVEEVIVLVDLGEGAPLIEDLPAVVAGLAEAGTGLDGRRLIAREPDGRWTGVEVAAGGRVHLLPIGRLPMEQAIGLLRARTGVFARA
jgi:GDSL-like lipase/acylhydrolase family protein